MTDKKLYYTDPLAAAYMAREFGAKLTCLHSDEQMSEYDIPENEREFDWFNASVLDFLGDVEMVEDAIKYIVDSVSKIHIHPDSLDIFEPQDGDRDEDGYTFKKGIGFLDKPFAHWESMEYVDNEFGPTNDFKVIHQGKTARRDNKPFFMPEAE